MAESQDIPHALKCALHRILILEDLDLYNCLKEKQSYHDGTTGLLSETALCGNKEDAAALEVDKPDVLMIEMLNGEINQLQDTLLNHKIVKQSIQQAAHTVQMQEAAFKNLTQVKMTEYVRQFPVEGKIEKKMDSSFSSQRETEVFLFLAMNALISLIFPVTRSGEEQSQVKRVMKPGGVLACYWYRLPECHYGSHSFNDVIEEVWESWREYWPPCHQFIMKDDIQLPHLYPDQVTVRLSERKFVLEREGYLDDFLGFLHSTAVFQNLELDKGTQEAQHSLDELRQRLVSKMGRGNEADKVMLKYYYALRMWRKPSH